jgi:hypothetical protein
MAGAVENKGEVMQGFAPTRLLNAQTSLNVATVLAIRVPAAVAYQINGTGPSVSMPSGVTLINTGISTILFGVATDVEVMDE